MLSTDAQSAPAIQSVGIASVGIGVSLIAAAVLHHLVLSPDDAEAQ